MDDRSFNDGLGDKLRAAGDVPVKTGRSARMIAGAVIGLAAAAVVLASKIWIGN